MRRVYCYLLCFCTLIFLSSCHVSSRTALTGSGGRNSYNESIKMTGLQQMLLNLVRLRYCDAPYFLDVSNVTTQFTYGSFINPTFPIPGANNLNPIQLGTGMSWQNQPTIQYTPLDGHNFANQLMQPINLVIIQHLILSGWDVDRIFKLTIQSLDEHYNAPTASGPVPEYAPDYQKFYEIMNLMKQFQQHHHLQVGVKAIQVKEKDDDDHPMYHGTSLQLSFPEHEPEATRLADMLEGIKTKKGRYILDMDLAYNEDAEIGIMPRSLLGCMYYLSLSVIVPPSDLILGRAFTTLTPEGEAFNWVDMMKNLMTIHYSVNYPENSYIAVKYRNYWFYINDSDNNSKKTFILLILLYNLLSGNGDAKKQPTLLTIPLGR